MIALSGFRTRDLLHLLVLACTVLLVAAENSKCEENDPNLKEMKYDLGDGNGEQTSMVYVDPDVTSYYKLTDPPSNTKVRPQFNGFQGKFINLSAKTLSLYWEDRAGGKMHLMRQHKGFTSSGTATFPGHRFYFTENNDPSKRLKFMEIGEYPENIYYYDPYTVEGDPVKTEENLKDLTPFEREKFDTWRKTLLYNEFYRNATGRTYLSNYLRSPPMHHMWRADYFGQEHWVTTKETHFVEIPPAEALGRINQKGVDRVLKDEDPRLLVEYRDPNAQIMNMTLKAISCSPRAFEITNFLSQVEVDHIMQVAGAANLQLSTTGDGAGSDKEDSRRTRTSFNSWVPREESAIMDAIYRRAADLQLVDESLMRLRDPDERPDVASKRSLAEHLQLVHYEVGQEYTAHHDFGFASIDKGQQGARFSTLLLYLNDDVEGGETAFPRFVNAETFHKLKVKPEVGKAVLFYSQLPDGNMDDFSHHSAEPVRVGEKWLMNLWFWDPIYQ